MSKEDSRSLGNAVYVLTDLFATVLRPFMTVNERPSDFRSKASLMFGHGGILKRSRFSTRKKWCVNFLMDLPSGFLVEFLKQFATRKKAVRQFFDGLYAYRLLSEAIP